MNEEDGGPAFPIVIDIGQRVEWRSGMTLRDYFAAKAMQALMNPDFTAQRMFDTYGTSAISYAAYEAADRMLKARGQ